MRALNIMNFGTQKFIQFLRLDIFLLDLLTNLSQQISSVVRTKIELLAISLLLPHLEIKLILTEWGIIIPHSLRLFTIVKTKRNSQRKQKVYNGQNRSETIKSTVVLCNAPSFWFGSFNSFQTKQTVPKNLSSETGIVSNNLCQYGQIQTSIKTYQCS